jgi:predicted metal-binding membrane protein
MPSPDRQRRTLLEAALRHQRWVTATLLVLVPAACWAWIVAMAADMHGAMAGPSAWMMTMQWDAPRLLLLFAMWAAMMTAMMLPSAAPLVLLYAGVLHSRNEPQASRRLYAMAGGYVFVWSGFSIAATVLQRILAKAFVLTPMMEPDSRGVAAILIAIAGVYQLTPLKARCLRLCRSPLSYLVQHWRPGTLGGFRLGVDHGLYCVGCCWALMLLLFAGGVMNLIVIVALAIWVLVEKLAPFGEHTARISGVALLAMAGWLVLA